MLQLERIRLAKQPDELEINVYDKNIFKLSDKELDQCAFAMQVKYKLVGLNTLEGDYLFYPELGYYTFPIFNFEESLEIHKGIAIPLKLNLALCLIPHSASESMIRHSRKNLSLFSVGLNEVLCKKVLVPPLECEISQSDLAKVINGMRMNAIEVQLGIDKMENLIRSMQAHF